MSSNQGEKLKSYVKRSQKSEQEMCEILKISRGTLYNWYNADRFTPNQLQKLKDAKISIDDIELDEKLKETPIYDIDVTAGTASFAELKSGNIVGYFAHQNHKHTEGFVRVSGDSMEPKFSSGDYIGFKKIEDMEIIQYGKPYIIETIDNQRMVKVLKKSTEKDYLILHSYNDEYQDLELPIRKIKSIYLVLARITGL